MLKFKSGKLNFRRPLENKMMINFPSTVKAYKTSLSIYAIIMVLLAGCATQVEQRDIPKIVQSNQNKVITSIAADQDEFSFNVHLKGSEGLTFTSVKQPYPVGVILYFPNTKLNGIQDNLVFPSGLVETIKSTEYNQQNSTARIEILLRNDVGYQVNKEPGGLLISFKNVPATNQNNNKADLDKNLNSSMIVPANFTQTDNSKTQITPAAYAIASDQTDQQVFPIVMAAETTESKINSRGFSSEASNSKQNAWMNRIDFSSEPNGKSTLIIGTTAPIRYEIKKTSPSKIQLQLINTNIPKYRQRPLITTRFKSAIDRIMPFQTSNTGSSSIVSIELREEVPYIVEQTDTLIMVHFEPSNIPPRPLDEANLPDWQQIIVQSTMEPDSGNAIPAAAAFSTPENITPAKHADEISAVESGHDAPLTSSSHVYAAGEFGSGKKKYIGEKISLDFYKTDIKNVFRILREVSGKNFAVDKDVSGSVTLTLDKPVPWDQVMDLVLKMNQLGMIFEQDIIRIATLDTLRKEEDQRSAQLEAAKKAQQQKESLEPIFTEYIAVNYSKAAAEVLPHVTNILTKERGSATVDGRNNQIIITDTREIIRQARELVKRIDKVTPQVIIEARIVEVSSNFSRELGVTWNTQIGPNENPTLDMDVGGNMAMNFPASGANSEIGISFERLTGLPFVLDAKINALESQGDGKVLSSPKIVTLDNKKARIKQGLEYPYLERDDAGGSSVKFKDIDLLLEVTPHVTPDNRISMNIFITKNDVATVTDGVPSISTNEAETELLVNDGDTIVIGGIIKASESSGESGFPGLSKIPIIGWLFKNSSRSDSKNELLIFMTPKIVQLEQL